MVKLFRVRGRSMLPTLGDGDFVIARRVHAGTLARLGSGAVVCVDHPQYGALIKRIRSINANVVTLSSDGQTGSEPEALGEIDTACITHRVRVAISARNGLRLL